MPAPSRAALLCQLCVDIEKIFAIDVDTSDPADWYFCVEITDDVGCYQKVSAKPIYNNANYINDVPDGEEVSKTIMLVDPTDYVNVRISLWDFDLDSDDVADISCAVGDGQDDYESNFPDAPSGAFLEFHYYVFRAGTETDHVYVDQASSYAYPTTSYYWFSGDSGPDLSTGPEGNDASVYIRIWDNCQDLSAPSAPIPDDGISSWSPVADRTFTWSPPSDLSGIYGYSWAVNSVPDYVVDTFSASVSFTGTQGVYTFYVRAMDNSGMWSNPGSHEFRIDWSLPTIAITSPPNGATVSGYVLVRASASDVLSGVQRVEFYIDGVFRWTDASAPYEFNWNTGSVGDGTHTLMAVAYDYASNSCSDSISVTVENTVIPEFSSSATVIAVISIMLMVIIIRQRTGKKGDKRN